MYKAYWVFLEHSLKLPHLLIYNLTFGVYYLLVFSNVFEFEFKIDAT